MFHSNSSISKNPCVSWDYAEFIKIDCTLKVKIFYIYWDMFSALWMTRKEDRQESRDYFRPYAVESQ